MSDFQTAWANREQAVAAERSRKEQLQTLVDRLGVAENAIDQLLEGSAHASQMRVLKVQIESMRDRVQNMENSHGISLVIVGGGFRRLSASEKPIILGFAG